MTPEQQNIAIAEACGWRHAMARHPKSLNIVTVWSDGKSPWCHIRKPPDYLGDLNAMHEAEKVLTDKEKESYIMDIACVIRHQQGISNYESIPQCHFSTFATAAQRAEAFLKTINKWEDEQ